MIKKLNNKEEPKKFSKKFNEKIKSKIKSTNFRFRQNNLKYPKRLNRNSYKKI